MLLRWKGMRFGKLKEIKIIKRSIEKIMDTAFTLKIRNGIPACGLAFFFMLSLAGCSNQKNDIDMEALKYPSDTATVTESASDPSGIPDIAGDIIKFTQEEDNAALDYISQVYHIDTTAQKPKVVLDTDMTFLGDDAFCLSILVQADQIGLIDLVGVTITGGNSFVSVGTNAALRQLELWGRPDIPVYMGTDEPLNGFRDIKEQSQVVGSIDPWGAMADLDNYVEPDHFHDLGKYYERKWGYSQTAPQEVSAVEFLLDVVSKNKNEITILSAGSPISIALACQEDADFARNVNEIIYIGGILFDKGSYTPYADFNCFYDAAAFKVCLGADFPRQIMIPYEVGEDVRIDKAVYDLLEEKGTTQISKFWVDNQGGLYRRNAKRKDRCADAIAATISLVPSVVVESQNYFVDIDDDIAHAEYGKLVLEPFDGNYNVSFITKLDTNQYWDFVTDLLCHVSKIPNCTYEEFVAESESSQ